MSNREIEKLEDKIISLMQFDDICGIIETEDDENEWREFEDEDHSDHKFVAGVKRFFKRLFKF